MVLHTWGQNLRRHIHVHAIVTGGALSPDRERWLPTCGNFLFPTKALSSVFRGKYLDFLDQAHGGGELRLPGTDGAVDFDRLSTTAIPRLGGLHQAAVRGRRACPGLSRALHPQDRHRQPPTRRLRRRARRFRWRDYADGNRRKTMRLHADEFVRRFLSHVLPRGFTRLRHYGLLANRGREDIALGFRVVRRARGWQSVAVAQPRLRVCALTPSTVIGRCTRTRTPKGRLMGTQGKWGGNGVRLGISWTMRVS